MIQYIWAYNDTDKYEIFEYQDLKNKFSLINIINKI